MIIILHVLIALGSMAQASYLYMRPSTRQLQTSYLLVVLTMISGFYLVVTTPGSIAETCVVGLVYLAVVSFGIAGATHKLAARRITHDDHKDLS